VKRGATSRTRRANAAEEEDDDDEALSGRRYMGTRQEHVELSCICKSLQFVRENFHSLVHTTLNMEGR
jgi:hypothetical protein